MLIAATTLLKFHHLPDQNTSERPYDLGIDDTIVSLSLSKDNNFVIYVQANARPEILSLKDLNNVKPIHIITAIDNVTVAIFQRTTKRVVALGTAISTVALYDTKTKSIGKLFGVPSPVVLLDFNADDSFLVAAGDGGVVTLFNVKEEMEVASFHTTARPSAMHFHPSKVHLFAVGANDGNLFVYDVKQAHPVYMHKAHTDAITGLVFNSKQSTLITVGMDCKFCVHDTNVKACILFRGHLQRPLTAIDATGDMKYIAIGCDNGGIYMYETQNLLTPRQVIQPDGEQVNFVQFAHQLVGIDAETEPNLVPGETSRSTVLSSLTKLKEERERAKAFYKNLVNKRDEREVLRLLKDDIIMDVQRSVQGFLAQMQLHIDNVQDFVKKEFEKMSIQMENKWDLLHMVTESERNSEEVVSEPYVFEADYPLVLE